MSLTKFIIIFSHLPIFITMVYAIVHYKRLGDELKVFCYFLFLSGIIQFASLACWFYGANNLLLLHIYVAVGFPCLAWFYGKVLHNFIHSKLIWIVTIVFLLFTLSNSLFIQKTNKFNTYALTVEAILIIILSLSTYMLLLNDIVKERRKHTIKSLNWINSGLFIYYSSSLLIFYFSAIISDTFPKILVRYTWAFHSFFSMVMYFCFFVGLWNRPKH
ncbi:MAG: hypothetical protein V4620_09515 [Bacteroidota bacterium]